MLHEVYRKVQEDKQSKEKFKNFTVFFVNRLLWRAATRTTAAAAGGAAAVAEASSASTTMADPPLRRRSSRATEKMRLGDTS